MKLDKRFLQYIYSSVPLQGQDFEKLNNDQGIFKIKFFDNEFRKPMVEKLQTIIESSNGGVFLISGYRGTGKTTFINYVLHSLKQKHPHGYISESLNLSNLKYDLKFEIICRMVFALKDAKLKGQAKKKLNKLEESILWELTIASSLGGSLKLKTPERNPIQVETGGFFKFLRKKAQRANIFRWEKDLREVLAIINRQSNKKMVFVLDELDKLPVLAGAALNEARFTGANQNGKRTDKGKGKAKSKNGGMNESAKSRSLLQTKLLEILSEIKSFLFESGAIFILVVNKDVYDQWKSQHSQEDLFMNVVTNMEYIPCYSKKEMELSEHFPLTIASNVDDPALARHYFETCTYHESYGNPRLFFQNLARKIRGNEIGIDQNDVDYLKDKTKMFELNEVLYNYVFRNEESGYNKLLLALYEMINLFNEEKEPLPPARKLLDSYYTYLKEECGYHFLRDKTSDNLVRKLATCFAILKEQDHLENFPNVNYVIRRLTDFINIISERHLITVKEVMNAMEFKEFEIKDAMGGYLIGLLIPLNIIILWNNNLLGFDELGDGEISIRLEYGYRLRTNYFQKACDYELKGNVVEALKNYNDFLKNEAYDFEIHQRKLEMLLCEHNPERHSEGIGMVTQWINSLLKMGKYLGNSNNKTHPDYNKSMARFLFFQNQFKKLFKTDVARYEDKLFQNHVLYIEKEQDQERYFQQAIQTEPESASLWAWKGDYYFYNNNYAAALEMYTMSLGLYNDPLTRIKKAKTYLRMKDFKSVKKELEEAEELSHTQFHTTLVTSIRRGIAANNKKKKPTFTGKKHYRGVLGKKRGGNKNYRRS